MTIKQISVFLENKPGRLAEFTEILSKNNIDLRALSVAEASDFGIIRIIVDDIYNATTVLKDADYICSVTKVIAVEIADEPGELAKLIYILGDNDINVEYMYALTTHKQGSAYMILRVADNAKAIEVLMKNGIRPASQEDLLKK